MARKRPAPTNNPSLFADDTPALGRDSTLTPRPRRHEFLILPRLLEEEAGKHEHAGPDRDAARMPGLHIRRPHP